MFWPFCCRCRLKRRRGGEVTIGRHTEHRKQKTETQTRITPKCKKQQHRTQQHRTQPHRTQPRSLRELDYWQQLDSLKMISLQWRLERYRILYIWKILENQVPNCGIKVKLETGRLGRMCEVPAINRHAKHSVCTMREQTF